MNPTPKPATHLNDDDATDEPEKSTAVSRILSVLAQEPNGLSDRKIAARAGVSRKKSTYRNAVSELRIRGLITDVPEGGKKLTDEGVATAADVPARPVGKKLINFYRREIGDGAARKIFDALLDNIGIPMSKDQIAQAASIDPATSTLRNGLSDLRKWDIIDGKKELTLRKEVVEALNE